MKTIATIKAELGQVSISFVEQFNEEKLTTGWAKHWDNEKRISVIIPMDLIAPLKASPEEAILIDRVETKYPKLFLVLPANATAEQIAEREASKYTLVTLFTPKNVVATF